MLWMEVDGCERRFAAPKNEMAVDMLPLFLACLLPLLRLNLRPSGKLLAKSLSKVPEAQANPANGPSWDPPDHSEACSSVLFRSWRPLFQVEARPLPQQSWSDV